MKQYPWDAFRMLPIVFELTFIELVKYNDGYDFYLSNYPFYLEVFFDFTFV